MSTLTAEEIQDLIDNHAQFPVDLFNAGQIIEAAQDTDLILIQNPANPTQVKVVLVGNLNQSQTAEILKRAYLNSAVGATEANSTVKNAVNAVSKTSGTLQSMLADLTVGGILTASAEIKLALANHSISATTGDGADTSRINLAGGGTADTARGGYLAVFGNEEGSRAGQVLLVAGDTGSIEFLGEINTDNGITAAGIVTAAGFLSSIAQQAAANSVTRRDFVEGLISGLSTVYLGINAPADDSGKLGGELPSFYATSTDNSDKISKTDGSAQAISSAITIGGTLTQSSDIVLEGSSANVRSNTADTADNKRINLVGGGSAAGSRCGYVSVFGNEEGARPGQVLLVAGDTGTIENLGDTNITGATGIVGDTSINGDVSLTDGKNIQVQVTKDTPVDWTFEVGVTSLSVMARKFPDQTIHLRFEASWLGTKNANDFGSTAGNPFGLVTDFANKCLGQFDVGSGQSSAKMYIMHKSGDNRTYIGKVEGNLTGTVGDASAFTVVPID